MSVVFSPRRWLMRPAGITLGTETPKAKRMIRVPFHSSTKAEKSPAVSALNAEFFIVFC